MRVMRWVTALWLFLGSLTAFGQGVIKPLTKSTKYNSFNLDINDRKAISAFFEYDIVEVFSPSNDVIGVVSEANSRLLNIIARDDKLQPTTLLVLDEADNVYSFVLSYSREPAHLVYKVRDLTIRAKRINAPISAQILAHGINNKKDDERDSLIFKRLFLKPKKVKDIAKRLNSVIFTLRSVFNSDDSYYFVVGVKNLSAMDYDVSDFRVFVRSFGSQSKRKLHENTLLKTGYVYPKVPKVVKQTQFFVIRVPKRTIGKDKYLSLEMVDGVGDRNVAINISLAVLNKSMFIDPQGGRL